LAALILPGLVSVLSLVLLRRGTHGRRGRQARIAVLLGFGGAVCVAWIARPASPVLALSLVLLGTFSTLALAFVWSAWQEGFWEDNQPPVEEIQQDVLRRHRMWLGNLASPPPVKRLFDICLACLGLIVSAPLLLVFLLWIWLEDPGPVFFVKNSVGRGGRNFRQWKLRTMVQDAEGTTGPVLASEEDARVLSSGRLLRKTALDELPQLLNILRGEMSFVGPRPQRTVLVHGYLQGMPEYAERHRVAPGIAGLAQVAGDYYLTPRQKLRYDRLYVAHAGLTFDLRLLLLAFLVVFWWRWRPGWTGRVPSRWIRRKRAAGSAASRQTTILPR
jgi:lipopolysaccharide/colanic/teichoic acid biosynthesis glycosyltransferase